MPNFPAAIKCRLILPPLEETTYEPAYRNLFVPGERVRVTCGDRSWVSTRQETTAEATCNDDGQWSVSPICQGIKLYALQTASRDT